MCIAGAHGRNIRQLRGTPDAGAYLSQTALPARDSNREAHLIGGTNGSGWAGIRCLNRALGGSACCASHVHAHSGGTLLARAAGGGARLIGSARKRW